MCLWVQLIMLVGMAIIGISSSDVISDIGEALRQTLPSLPVSLIIILSIMNNKTHAPIPKGRVAVSVITPLSDLFEGLTLEDTLVHQDALWWRGPRRRRVLCSVVWITPSASPKGRTQNICALFVSRTPSP